MIDDPNPRAADDLPRWAELGLVDPRRDGKVPEGAEPADVMIHALAQPGAVDPAEGILEGVAADQEAIAQLLASGARRIAAALMLMRRADERPRPVPPDDGEQGEEHAPAATTNGEPAAASA